MFWKQYILITAGYLLVILCLIASNYGADVRTSKQMYAVLNIQHWVQNILIISHSAGLSLSWSNIHKPFSEFGELFLLQQKVPIVYCCFVLLIPLWNQEHPLHETLCVVLSSFSPWSGKSWHCPFSHCEFGENSMVFLSQLAFGFTSLPNFYYFKDSCCAI